MLRRILVSVSHSPAAAAQSRIAVELARQHNAKITGCAIVDVDRIGMVGPAPVGAFSYRVRLIEARLRDATKDANDSLIALGDECKRANVVYQAVSLRGDTDETLSSVWRFQDLALIPTRPWSPGERNADDVAAVLHLIAMGLRPMLAVPEQSEWKPASTLVALSGSLDSAKAFKQFVQSDLCPDANLHLVTAGKPKSGESPDRLLDKAEAYAIDHGFKVSKSSLPSGSDRTTTLLEEAERVDAGVIVIGSSYRRFLAFEQFGSHATGILERSKVPVFVSH
ncbi:universal stress protein [Limibacillus halophilus]|uniref:Nucleotide-binding universal stress UspA family protein n=1 Tax=Limibacillus halophilus TaxID=1579333 RepID=A0A839SVN2_9PROT|nr:universal stress protein [Limibacillus halophilus]MBB3065003.1 nucleotide-binding universal stress UspA family protein [Limibacillus halophilus]